MKHFIKQNTNQDNDPNNFFRSVCGLAIPVTLQSLIQSSFSVVDQLMLSLEECVRLAISLVVFRRKKWMKSLS